MICRQLDIVRQAAQARDDIPQVCQIGQDEMDLPDKPDSVVIVPAATDSHLAADTAAHSTRTASFATARVR